MSCLAYCFLNLPVSSSIAGGSLRGRSFGLAPFLTVVIFMLFCSMNLPNADFFEVGSTEVAI